MRIDSHQHFWTYDPARYPWIEAGMEVLARDYGPEDLAPHLEAAGLEGSIAVQARQDLEETAELLAFAKQHPHVLGVVGWVDLAAEDAAAQLDQIRCPELVGIRHVLQAEPDDEHMLRPDFQRGLGLLAERGLVYDLLLLPQHLPVAPRLVAAHPDQTFVLDHLAKPFIARGELEPWGKDLDALAKHPHVHLKLSGMITEADWAKWTPADLEPYLDRALAAFGPERVMFGSDWPVCQLAGSYERVVDALTQWAERQGSGLQDGLWGGNAARVYGLSS